MLHDRVAPRHRSEWRPKPCTACGHVEPWSSESDCWPEERRSTYIPRCSCGWAGEPTTDPEAAHAEHVASVDPTDPAPVPVPDTPRVVDLMEQLEQSLAAIRKPKVD